MTTIASNIGNNFLNGTLADDLVEDLTAAATFKSQLNIGTTDKAPLSSDLSDNTDSLEGSQDARSSGLDGTTDLNQALAEAKTVMSPFMDVPLGNDLSNQHSFELASGSLVPLYTSSSDAFSSAESPTQFQQSTSSPGPALEYLVVPGPTATINVTYNGFTPQAQAAFQYAVDIWESLVSSPVAIQVQANFTPLGTGVLGSAGPTEFWRDFSGAPVANTFYPVALANSRRGADLNPGAGDIDANFSSNFTNWYFGTDGNTPAGQFDFATVVLHELCHGLGFLGSMNVNSGGQGSWGISGFPTIYDRFNENGAGQNLVNGFPNNSTALGNELTSNNVFFNGPNANAANGGRPRLFAPSTWNGGSSIAHLDEATYSGTINGLMTPSLAPGEVVHQPGAIGFGMFQDMGWNMNTQGWIYGTPGNNSLTGTAIAQNIYGLEGQDTLNGLEGNDFIDGGGGADFLIGGLGDDTYIVDNPSDFGSENAGEGTDTYTSSATSFQMDANVENLTMLAGAISATGTGIANTMTGNSANNTLNGGAGSDRMIGGLGDDTYIVDDSLDFGIENSGEGTDSYLSSATSFGMDANVENLTMLAGAVSASGTDIANTMTGNSANNALGGLAGNDILDGGTGNDSLDGGDGDDFLKGNVGNDIVNGGSGNDNMIGGADNDTLDGGEGNDTLNGAKGNDILKGNVGNDFVDGGEGNDSVTGGSKNDTLVGGSGNDQLTGALDKDKFLYDTGRAFVKADVGRDTITDLDRKAGGADTIFDQLVLDKTTFTSLASVAGVGFSVAGEFKTVTSDNAAKTSSGEIIYNKTNDKLFYNQNGAGSGFGTGDLFATLTGITSLAATDFLIQA